MQFFLHSSVFLRNLSLLSFVFVLSNTTLSAQSPDRTTTSSSTNQQTTALALNPTQTVQEFYKAMRERRFRDAMMLTNLRAAVVDLSAQEIKDLNPNFEPMVSQIPEKIQVGDEQINGDAAKVSVTAPESANIVQKREELRLRRDNGTWLILSADEEAEGAAKREGKNYFFKLQLDLQHGDVEITLQDILKSEIAYSLQNNNVFGDLPALVKQGTVSPDVLDPDAFGYRFKLELSSDKKKYLVHAEPTQYGKTGKLSFILAGDGKGAPRIQSADKGGAPLLEKN